MLPVRPRVHKISIRWDFYENFMSDTCALWLVQVLLCLIPESALLYRDVQIDTNKEANSYRDDQNNGITIKISDHWSWHIRVNWAILYFFCVATNKNTNKQASLSAPKSRQRSANKLVCNEAQSKLVRNCRNWGDKNYMKDWTTTQTPNFRYIRSNKSQRHN